MRHFASYHDKSAEHCDQNSERQTTLSRRDFPIQCFAYLGAALAIFAGDDKAKEHRQERLRQKKTNGRLVYQHLLDDQSFNTSENPIYNQLWKKELAPGGSNQTEGDSIEEQGGSKMWVYFLSGILAGTAFSWLFFIPGYNSDRRCPRNIVARSKGRREWDPYTDDADWWKR